MRCISGTSRTRSRRCPPVRAGRDKLGPNVSNHVSIYSLSTDYFSTIPSIPTPPYTKLHYPLLSFALHFVPDSIIVHLFSHVQHGNSDPGTQHDAGKRERGEKDRGKR
jgi:hypothetical protein